MKRLAFLAAVVCLWGSAMAGTARAGFVGQSVDVSYLFPDVNTVFQDIGTQTIAAGGTVYTDSFGDQITVFDTSITISNVGGNVSAAFNGFGISEVGPSPETITGVSLVTTDIPGFDASLISFDSTDVFVNFQSLVDAGTVTLDVNFAATAAPEPASLTLLGIGAAGLFACGKRRRNRTA